MSNAASLPQEIEETLRNNLTVTKFELIDESSYHIGHAGSKGGAKHYHLIINADEFADKSLVARHQMIYKLLGHFITNNQIHALRIQAG